MLRSSIFVLLLCGELGKATVHPAVELFATRVHSLAAVHHRALYDKLAELSKFQEELLSEYSLDRETFHEEYTRALQASDCSQVAPEADVLDRSEWMADFLSHNVSLREITLPGTHDAGAYSLTTEINPNDPGAERIAQFGLSSKMIGELVCPFALTQTHSFTQQLRGGIRYFDLRVDYDSNQNVFRLYHLLFGQVIDAPLVEIRNFLESKPSEIVVLEMTNFHANVNDTVKEVLQATIVNTFGTLLYPRTSSGTIEATIGEMQETNQRVVMVVQDPVISNHASIWPQGTIVNTYADTPKVGKMIAYNEERMDEFQTSTAAFYKISWTLTPDTAWIVGNLGNKQGLFSLANAGNQVLPGFVTAQKLKGRSQFGQILIVDYYETGQLMQVLLARDTNPRPQHTSGSLAARPAPMLASILASLLSNFRY